MLFIRFSSIHLQAFIEGFRLWSGFLFLVSLANLLKPSRSISIKFPAGDFSLSEGGYQELKRDSLALVVTVVDIVDGAAYLFKTEPPADRRNWKAELELEQYSHVLGLDSESGKLD